MALLAGASPPLAGRRPQPFVMHKMAFHRGRALGIIRRTLHSSLPENAEAQAGKSQTDSHARSYVEGRCRALDYFMNAGRGMKRGQQHWLCAESGGVLKDAILHCGLALKQPSALWPQPECIEFGGVNFPDPDQNDR